MAETGVTPPDLTQSFTALLWLLGPAGFGAIGVALLGYLRQRRDERVRMPGLALYTDRTAIDDAAGAIRRLCGALEDGNNLAREGSLAMREQAVALREQAAALRAQTVALEKLADAQRERTEAIIDARTSRRRERSSDHQG